MDLSRKSILTDRPPKLIVKVGGSLALSGHLRTITSLLADTPTDIVIVPGGGVHADGVRSEQARLAFSDRAAHHMAILAMHQTGVMLADLAPRLQPVENLVEIEVALKAGRVPVWLPANVVLQDATLPMDWTITSDGLAARLAEYLGVGHIVLLKPQTSETGLTATELAAAGIVDKWFAKIAARSKLRSTILGADQIIQLEQLLAQADACGAETL